MSRKLEEKQRRRQAEERRRQQQRRAARRRNLTTFLIALLVTGIVVALVIWDRGQEEERETELTSTAAEDAGCTGVEEHEIEGDKHVAEGTDVTYETVPPTSGDHFETPAAADFYAAPVPEEQLVHNLEHSMIVIWYAPDAPTEVIEGLEAIQEQESAATIAAPYDGITSPSTFALTAWGVSQECERVSQEVVDAFRREYQGVAGPEKVVPPFEG